MKKAYISVALFFFCVAMVSDLHSSDSNDLNTNPQMDLYPQVDSMWLEGSTHSDAKDLIFHINVLKILRSGSCDEAIKILENELVKKGEKTEANHIKLKPKINDDKNPIRKDIDSAIRAYNKYVQKYFNSQN